jgi:acyl carrier protein
MSTVRERVVAVIEEISGMPLSDVDDDVQLSAALGWDSLDGVEVLMGLEEEFEDEVDDETAEKMSTLNQIVEYCETHI